MGQAAASEGWELLLVEQTFMERLLDARRWARCSCYRQRGNIGPALQTLSIFEPRALMPVEKARQKLDMQGTDGALSVGGGAAGKAEQLQESHSGQCHAGTSSASRERSAGPPGRRGVVFHVCKMGRIPTVSTRSGWQLSALEQESGALGMGSGSC